jgi:hypothetical protein
VVADVVGEENDAAEAALAPADDPLGRLGPREAREEARGGESVELFAQISL